MSKKKIIYTGIGIALAVLIFLALSGKFKKKSKEEDYSSSGGSGSGEGESSEESGNLGAPSVRDSPRYKEFVQRSKKLAGKIYESKAPSASNWLMDDDNTAIASIKEADDVYKMTALKDSLNNIFKIPSIESFVGFMDEGNELEARKLISQAMNKK